MMMCVFYLGGGGSAVPAQCQVERTRAKIYLDW